MVERSTNHTDQTDWADEIPYCTARHGLADTRRTNCITCFAKVRRRQHYQLFLTGLCTHALHILGGAKRPLFLQIDIDLELVFDDRSAPFVDRDV
jgi:hypothetical protein